MKAFGRTDTGTSRVLSWALAPVGMIGARCAALLHGQELPSTLHTRAADMTAASTSPTPAALLEHPTHCPNHEGKKGAVNDAGP
jgi:hypothetical protein